MRQHAYSLAAIILLGLIPGLFRAQDFSAEVVYLATKKKSSTPGKSMFASRPASVIYVSQDKMRLETRGLTGTILLVDEGKQTAVALFPARKGYQYLPGGPSEYFRVKDPENACPDWQMATTQKVDCEKLGDEVLDGRHVVKYRNKNASHAATSAVWIDVSLKFVVKWESSDIAAELRNIREDRQPAALFAIPVGYHTLKPLKGKSGGFSQRSH